MSITGNNKRISKISYPFQCERVPPSIYFISPSRKKGRKFVVFLDTFSLAFTSNEYIRLPQSTHEDFSFIADGLRRRISQSNIINVTIIKTNISFLSTSEGISLNFSSITVHQNFSLCRKAKMNFFLSVYQYQPVSSPRHRSILFFPAIWDRVPCTPRSREERFTHVEVGGVNDTIGQIKVSYSRPIHPF